MIVAGGWVSVAGGVVGNCHVVHFLIQPDGHLVQFGRRSSISFMLVAAICRCTMQSLVRLDPAWHSVPTGGVPSVQLSLGDMCYSSKTEAKGNTDAPCTAHYSQLGAKQPASWSVRIIT